jgi:hypothetical protein
MGTADNLAVAQLPLHVAHDALPQRGHACQVVRVCLVHDAKPLNGAIDDGVIAVNPANHLSRGPGLGKSKEAEDVKGVHPRSGELPEEAGGAA